MVHNIFDSKCFQLYFTFSQDNFIFDDVISMSEMSFVFKNGCMYVLGHYSYMVTPVNQSLTTIFKVAGYFSGECVRSLEEHIKKLEINLRGLLCPFIFVHK